jgi:hypothetical protein
VERKSEALRRRPANAGILTAAARKAVKVANELRKLAVLPLAVEQLQHMGAAVVWNGVNLGAATVRS